MGVKLLFAILLVAFTCVTSFARPPGTGPTEAEIFRTEPLTPFDGKTIKSIRINGLYYTKERAARWLLTQHEGDRFSADEWVVGLHRLYNTAVLYNLKTEIKPVEHDEIEITLNLRDRWSLLPFVTALGDGATQDFSFGVYDLNLGGYFTNAQLAGYSYGGALGYDLNLFQEWLFDTDYSVGLDLSRIGTPLSAQNRQGQFTQNFTWVRSQQQAVVGQRFGEFIRSFLYIERYNDTMTHADAGTQTFVYTGPQYRVRPTFIFGRSHLSNFLEEGSEFTVAPSTANFFNVDHDYHRITLSYKRTKIVRGNNNVAGFIGGGAMTSAPAPYLFKLGGLDTVRGFNSDRIFGNYYVNAIAEYRPYLFSFQSPILNLETIVVQGDVFSDFGAMWGSSNVSGIGTNKDSQLTMVSAGAGIRIIALKLASAIGRFDLARTLTPNEGWGFSFGVQQFF